MPATKRLRTCFHFLTVGLMPTVSQPCGLFLPALARARSRLRYPNSRHIPACLFTTRRPKPTFISHSEIPGCFQIIACLELQRELEQEPQEDWHLVKLSVNKKPAHDDPVIEFTMCRRETALNSGVYSVTSTGVPSGSP